MSLYIVGTRMPSTNTCTDTHHTSSCQTGDMRAGKCPFITRMEPRGNVPPRAFISLFILGERKKYAIIN